MTVADPVMIVLTDGGARSTATGRDLGVPVEAERIRPLRSGRRTLFASPSRVVVQRWL